MHTSMHAFSLYMYSGLSVYWQASYSTPFCLPCARSATHVTTSQKFKLAAQTHQKVSFYTISHCSRKFWVKRANLVYFSSYALYVISQIPLLAEYFAQKAQKILNFFRPPPKTIAQQKKTKGHF